MHAYHLNFETLDNEFCKFHKRKFWRNPSSEGQLEMAKVEIAFENFSLLTSVGRPLELGHLKNLYIIPPSSSAPSSPQPLKIVRFLTLPPFDCAFEPLSYFFSSVPSSPRPSKVVRFLTLPSFSSASLSPRLLFECAFEPSTILLSAPSSPHFLRASISWIVRLRALSCQLLINPRIFPLGR